MDTIYQFTWSDITGDHSTTVVGSAEYRDQYQYLSTLHSVGMVWNVDYSVIGQDI